MIDEITKNICKVKDIEFTSNISFKEHCEFMQKCNREMWKGYIDSIKEAEFNKPYEG